jgi:hypothetical protein
MLNTVEGGGEMDLMPNTQVRVLHALPAEARARARGELLWFGVALLTLARIADAGPAELHGMPAGTETFIEREPPTLGGAPLAAAAPRMGAPSAAAAVDGRPAPALAATASLAGGRVDPLDLTLGSLRDPLGMPLVDLTAPQEFRPRPRSLLDAEPARKAEDSLMSDSDIWQRLASEYRGQRRLRVLTIWDAGWSSLSLQAGRHGDPSLQWTGQLLGRSETHRGVLDRWIPGFTGAGAIGRGVAHAITSTPRTPAASPSHAGAAPP